MEDYAIQYIDNVADIPTNTSNKLRQIDIFNNQKNETENVPIPPFEVYVRAYGNRGDYVLLDGKTKKNIIIGEAQGIEAIVFGVKDGRRYVVTQTLLLAMASSTGSLHYNYETQKLIFDEPDTKCVHIAGYMFHRVNGFMLLPTTQAGVFTNRALSDTFDNVAEILKSYDSKHSELNSSISSVKTSVTSLQSQIDAIKNQLYPVGVIQWIANSTTPSALGLPGTWQKMDRTTIRSYANTTYGLDITGANIADGTNVDIWPVKTTSNHQAWKLFDSNMNSLNPWLRTA